MNVTIDDLTNGQQYANLAADGRRAWDQAWTEIKDASMKSTGPRRGV